MNSLFRPLDSGSKALIDRLPCLIEEVFPLPGRFRAGLHRDVAELSRLLTSGRTERGNSYLGKPAMLSAYLRYFLPWNVYRLSKLFASLPLQLKPNDAINDLGAGPLTLALSLWISRKELRNVPLEFRSFDRTAAVLEAGKKLFAALVNETGSGVVAGSKEYAEGNSAPFVSPWTIRTVRGEIKRNGSLSAEIKGKPAALSAAVNVYNEIFWDFSPRDSQSLVDFAVQQARLLSSITEETGSILVVEPGIPRSGEFISLLRSCLVGYRRLPLSPCVHGASCPLSGGQPDNKIPPARIKSPYGSVSGKSGGIAGAKKKWCHFAFDTEDAPKELRKLSAAAGIPKERAALSFILSRGVSNDTAAPAGASVPGAKSPAKIRIISDAFPLPGNNSWGRYGCGGNGLVLVKGSRKSLDDSPSGAVEELVILKDKTDPKSGAFLALKQL